MIDQESELTAAIGLIAHALDAIADFPIATSAEGCRLPERASIVKICSDLAEVPVGHRRFALWRIGPAARNEVDDCGCAIRGQHARWAAADDLQAIVHDVLAVLELL